MHVTTCFACTLGNRNMETFTAAFTMVCLFLILFLLWYLLFVHTDMVLAVAEVIGRPASDLRGQIIWVTGASSGLGEAMCYELASVGAKLILSARNAVRLEEVKEKCLELSGRKLQSDDILVVPFDITDYSVHEVRANEVLNHFGKIDILINNAGIMQLGWCHNTDLQVYKEVFEINCFGYISLTQVVLKHFLKTGKGHFVAVSSITGKCAIPTCAAYCASKFAVQGYFDALRAEYHDRNIQVTVVCPGMFASSLQTQCRATKRGEIFQDRKDYEYAMPTSRCAHLALIAVANKLQEVWIAYQMGLLMGHGAQYIPDACRFFLPLFFTRQKIEALCLGNWPNNLPFWKPVSAR